MLKAHSRWIPVALAVACVGSVAGCLKPTLQFVPTTLSMRRSLAIPDTYPLGSVPRAHYHQMETNGEADDFVINRHEFIRSTAELNTWGLDHVLEIAARAPSNPFPILIERSENNSDPELDQHRRLIVTRILAEKGVTNAANRVAVSQSYDRGYFGEEADRAYFQFIQSGGNGNNNGGGGGAGGGGGGGIGGGGGGGF
ncbi:MAG: hypothetical protein H8E37_04525 [Planctomycetes bacterium]|nr:hypothetical protein [Planctomycetota bacterium]